MVGLAKWSKIRQTSQVVLVILLLKRKKKKNHDRKEHLRPSLCQEQDRSSLLEMISKAAPLGDQSPPLMAAPFPPPHSPARSAQPPRHPLLTEEGCTKHGEQCYRRLVGVYICPGALRPFDGLSPTVSLYGEEDSSLLHSPGMAAALPQRSTHPLPCCGGSGQGLSPGLGWDWSTIPEVYLNGWFVESAY